MSVPLRQAQDASERFADAALAAGRTACAGLGWRPGEFWDATPAELAMALEGLVGVRGEAAALGRGELGQMMERNPDGR